MHLSVELPATEHDRMRNGAGFRMWSHLYWYRNAVPLGAGLFRWSVHVPDLVSGIEFSSLRLCARLCLWESLPRVGHDVPLRTDLLWQQLYVPDVMSCAEHGRLRLPARVGLRDNVQRHRYDVSVGSGLLGVGAACARRYSSPAPYHAVRHSVRLRDSLSRNRHNVFLGSGLLGWELRVPDELPVGEHCFMWFVTRVSLWCLVSGHGHDVLLWPNLHRWKLQGGGNLQWRG